MKKKMIFKKRNVNVSQSNALSSLYNNHLMITYGAVDSNNTDGTTNILLVTGLVVERIKLLSTVFPSKEPTIGGVKYPPVGAQVIILHPINDLNSGFALPAPLDERDTTVTSDLLNQGDKELLQGGWETTFDPATGKRTLTNGTFDLTVDPDGETISLTDFKGNTFKNNDTAWEINGTTEVARKADTTKLAMTALDIQALAVSLLATGGFVPASAPVPGTPITFTGGEITSGSDKVKVG